MTAIIIIGIIIYLVYVVADKQQTYKQSYEANNTDVVQKKYDRNVGFDFDQNNFISNKIYLGRSSSRKSYNDDSIIDVTNQNYIINSNNSLKKYSGVVPYWAHRYVYSYSELNSASFDQKKFYNNFKDNFLNGVYFDLEGNTNYAFILLFDMLNEYNNHKDISKLKSQLKILGQYYPKTKSYGASFLFDIIELERNGNNFSRQRLGDEYKFEKYNSDYDYWKLGTKYKTKLNLKDQEVNLLNNLWYQGNVFFDIEYCKIETIKYFVLIVHELDLKYLDMGTNIVSQFELIAGEIVVKLHKFRKGSRNYKSSVEQLKNSFYLYIFKFCENTVREIYNHKRKLIPYSQYTPLEEKEIFESKILVFLTEISSLNFHSISLPDSTTEIELNSLNKSRWKISFTEITSNYNNSNEFINSIIEIGKLNKKNPSFKNIYFEASKFIAKYDKVASLTLYIHYLYQDLKSSTFDNKQLTKTLQKKLFKTNEQLHDFEQIVSRLINDKDLNEAVKAVPKVYEVKRKKIQLDRIAIKEVQQQHSGTVELLNEYLRDEFEDENNTIQSQEISSEEIKIEIIQKNEESHQSIFLSELSLNPTHISILELFSKNNFSIPQIEIEEFAKSKGVFKNQVIESINETCYEVLDDVLIEEEDEYYTIIPEYFQKISTK